MRKLFRYSRPVAALICLTTIGVVLRAAGQERPRYYREAPQQVPAPLPTQPASPNIPFSSDEDYRIGATDVLQITVQDAPELSNTVRVNASGIIPMGFLGQLKAAGKTPEELQKQIADGLRGEYLTDPQVSVVVVQYNSRSLFIQGAVKTPGVYIIEGRPSLLKLITMPGGLVENHGSTAFVIREIKSPKPDQPVRARTIKAAADVQQTAGQSAQPAANDAAGASAAAPDEEDARYEMKQVNINS